MSAKTKTDVTTLIICRGIQGSGKTTWAEQQVRKNPDRFVKVSRDDLRQLVYSRAVLTPSEEMSLTKMQLDLIRGLLLTKKNVIVHDMNLNSKTIKAFFALAQEFEGNVQFRVQDFPVDYKKAIERDKARGLAGGRTVGEQVIKDTVNRWLSGGSELPNLDAKYYEPITKRVIQEQDSSLPSAWIVDIDGTLSNLMGRSPYAYDKVDEDLPIEHVVQLVKNLKDSGHKIVLMTGREAVAHDLTVEWLKSWGVDFDELHMRATEDRRKDSTVKKELYRENIVGKYSVAGVLDDRHTVVEMWRSEGLFCAQVANGLF